TPDFCSQKIGVWRTAKQFMHILSVAEAIEEFDVDMYFVVSYKKLWKLLIDRDR
ncbi:MAG: hypothetical protein H6Q71_1545, partial [Firmicutes bacterium]|nr:hypothetical protein [Bacillota bacterium]